MKKMFIILILIFFISNSFATNHTTNITTNITTNSTLGIQTTQSVDFFDKLYIGMSPVVDLVEYFMMFSLFLAFIFYVAMLGFGKISKFYRFLELASIYLLFSAFIPIILSVVLKFAEVILG